MQIDRAELGQICQALVRALGAGDLEAAVACFAESGCLITPDATQIRGHEQIRRVLAQLIARHTEVIVESRELLATDDVILSCERWTIRADGVEGTRFRQAFHPTLVLRGRGGEWKLAIAALWGWGRLDPSRD